MVLFSPLDFSKNPRSILSNFGRWCGCLNKDWDKMTTFFSFPASHWTSIRITNPIESSFASVKLRTKSTRGSGSAATATTMAFKLLQECEKKWRKIRGWQELEKLLAGLVTQQN